MDWRSQAASSGTQQGTGGGGHLAAEKALWPPHAHREAKITPPEDDPAAGEEEVIPEQTNLQPAPDPAFPSA